MVPKFRAWHMPFGPKGPMQEMVHGKASSILAFAEMSPDEYIVEQFTGLKDAEGKEIYENDIIKYFGANKRVKIKTTYGIVFFDSEHGCFNSRIQNEEHNKGGISPLDDLIVGNVHENPELLEAQHDTQSD